MFRFRLRHVILMMTWAIVSGAILVAAFSAGWYGWWPVALAVGLHIAGEAMALLTRLLALTGLSG